MVKEAAKEMSEKEPEPATRAARITIPLFPLPDVVLFPGQVLPLHIFEPRYRRMVEDVLSGDHRIGMALLKPGWESDYAGSPAIHPTVGFGIIEASKRLPDGRFDIELRGEGRGRVEAEVQRVPYRKAVLAIHEDRPASPDLGSWIARLEGLVAELDVEFSAAAATSRPQGVDLVYAVAASLPVEPGVKLGLLELDDPVARARRVVEILEGVLSRRRTFDRFRPIGEADVRRN